MKWFLPAIILSCLLVLVLFVVGLFAVIRTAFVSSYPYKVAMARANASPEVATKIGSPIRVGWLMTGNINTSGPTGSASFDIPISGPKGKGEISVIAKKQANHWTFETLEVDVEGQDSPIRLEDPVSNPPAESPDKPI